MKTQYNKSRFDTKDWDREEHFQFFKSFAKPFFNVHTEVDITKLYHYAKWERISVLLAYLHAATEGMRATENFLLRLEGDEVVKYEAMDISTTVLKENKTVSFVHLPHHSDLHTFCRQAAEIIAQVKKSNGLFSGYNGPDLIHATTLPWFKYNGMEHAAIGDPGDSIPKLAFGQLEFRDGQVILPMSVQVHHALMDGYHIHLFIENMRASMNAIGASKPVSSITNAAKQKQLKSFVQRLMDQVMNGIHTPSRF